VLPRELECHRWQDADYGQRAIVDEDRATDDRRITAELALPPLVREDGNVVRPGPMLLGEEPASARRTYTEDVGKGVADERVLHGTRHAAGDERAARVGVV
jgi:hypothetical protein